MTPDEYAAHFAKRIRESWAVEDEIRNIASEINSLEWAEDRRPLSYQERLRIAEDTLAKLDAPAPGTTGRVGIRKEADNKKYLAVAAQLKALLKG